MKDIQQFDKLITNFKYLLISLKKNKYCLEYPSKYNPSKYKTAGACTYTFRINIVQDILASIKLLVPVRMYSE